MVTSHMAQSSSWGENLPQWTPETLTHTELQRKDAAAQVSGYRVCLVPLPRTGDTSGLTGGKCTLALLPSEGAARGGEQTRTLES